MLVLTALLPSAGRCSPCFVATAPDAIHRCLTLLGALLMMAAPCWPVVFCIAVA
jgi:hypothetical protein